MREMLQKIFSKPTKTYSHPKKGKHKSRGQSLVELTLALPVLLLLFSGLVEFGFMLNYYLSLLDATRYSARQYSNADPHAADPNTTRNDPSWFYHDSLDTVVDQLQPRNANDTSRKIILDPSKDDVIVTAYAVSGTTVTTVASFHKFNNQPSILMPTDIQNLLVSGAPCEGMLVVEVDYNYHQVLNLPWMAWLGNPTLLHAYTVMPLQAVEPVC